MPSTVQETEIGRGRGAESELGGGPADTAPQVVGWGS
jgi:hypothetical protein